MKLNENDLRNACDYIVDGICKEFYGENYKEKGIRFEHYGTPFSVRTCVNLFIEWLKIRAKKQEYK